jgi:serine/threonine protein kinase
LSFSGDKQRERIVPPLIAFPAPSLTENQRKVLHDFIHNDGSDVARFVETLKKLEESKSGQTWYVFEYCPEGDLAALISEQKEEFAMDDVVSWCIQLCEGLQVIHDSFFPGILAQTRPRRVFWCGETHEVG